MNSNLYLIELRASYFDSELRIEYMAHKGLKNDVGMIVRLAKVPAINDNIEFDNLMVYVSETVLHVNPRPDSPVARCWVRVKV